MPDAKQKMELERVFRKIVDNNLAQPRVFVHRDYHSRNLMVIDPNPGILDFQDAVYGPITYDLVSLFKDAYIRWDEEHILDWVIRYWEQARKLGLPVAMILPTSTATSNGWVCSDTSRFWGYLRVCIIATAKAVTLGHAISGELFEKGLRALSRTSVPLLTLLDEWEDNKPPETKVGYTF